MSYKMKSFTDDRSMVQGCIDSLKGGDPVLVSFFNKRKAESVDGPTTKRIRLEPITEGTEEVRDDGDSPNDRSLPTPITKEALVERLAWIDQRSEELTAKLETLKNQRIQVDSEIANYPAKAKADINEQKRLCAVRRSEVSLLF